MLNLLGKTNNYVTTNMLQTYYPHPFFFFCFCKFSVNLFISGVDENRWSQPQYFARLLSPIFIGQWDRAFESSDVIYFQCIGVDGTILIVNGQQITVDFGGKKWTLHEMTLAKVSSM